MDNRVALVTGAGRGIGRASACLLAEQGCRVAVSARTESELNSVVQEIEAAGGTASAITSDLSDRRAPEKLVARVNDLWGPIEILVNNAGIGSSQNPMPIVDFDDDFWDLTMMVNVTAPYLLTKLVLPKMIEARWGRIINIASINAKIPAFHGAAYVASKHAIGGFTKATAREAGEFGITCNAVCPGVTATLMNDKRLQYDAKRLGTSFEQLESQASLLGRRLLPAEIAATVAFLASDAAGTINGQLINVCGGLLMA